MAESGKNRGSRLKVLVTITDGVDTDLGVGEDVSEGTLEWTEGMRVSDLAGFIRDRQVFSLSCGIGLQDVHHWGLAQIARMTGGLHIAISHSSGIAQALAHLTEFMLVRILGAQVTATGSNVTEVRRCTVIQQAIQRLAADVLILLDCSYSMVGMYTDPYPTGDATKLPCAKAAALELINSLNPEFDRAGVVSFCAQVRVLCRLTHDFETCVEAVRGIEPGFKTSLYRAMEASASLLSPIDRYDCPACGGTHCQKSAIRKMGWLAAKCRTCGELVRVDEL